MIFWGDFHVTDDKNHKKSFCENYSLQNLIRKPACYKTSSNPAFTDLILTNVLRSYQSTCVIVTGLSDFHPKALTVIRKNYQSKTKNYRSYKKFSNEVYRETLKNNLCKENLINNDDGFQRFCHISLDALNKHAPCKKSMVEVIKCLSAIKNYRK